jgi:hypothetical protein
MLIVLILALAGLTGCVSNPTQAEIKFLETREIDLPYEETYTAAVNTMFSMGLTITHTDKASGVISAQSGDHAMRATMRRSQQKKHQVKKVTLMVTPRGDRLTQLRMKVLINEEQKLDRELMTAIWQRLEREAMLDTRPPRGR